MMSIMKNLNPLNYEEHIKCHVLAFQQTLN